MCDHIVVMSTRGGKPGRVGKDAVREPAAAYNVREAKARFSELIRLAGEGAEITITSHGRPAARLGPAADQRGKSFTVDFDWLRTMRVGRKQTPAERIVREDREARG